MKFKKTILIDLDGVLNKYSGNYDENYIPPIKEGAKEFLKNLSKEYEIKIFTARNKNLTKKWLIEFNVNEYISDITNVKEPCMVYVDDRCVTFDGNYENLANCINNFKPWYKK